MLRRVRPASRPGSVLQSGTQVPAVGRQTRSFGLHLSARQRCAAVDAILCDHLGRRATEARIWEEVLKALATTPELVLAYPTTRFYTAGEGRPKGGELPNLSEIDRPRR